MCIRDSSSGQHSYLDSDPNQIRTFVQQAIEAFADSKPSKVSSVDFCDFLRNKVSDDASVNGLAQAPVILRTSDDDLELLSSRPKHWLNLFADIERTREKAHELAGFWESTNKKFDHWIVEQPVRLQRSASNLVKWNGFGIAAWKTQVTSNNWKSQSGLC